MELTSKKFRKIILIGWILILTPFIIMLLLFFGICMNWFGEMPRLEDLDNPLANQSSEIFAGDGVLLGTYYFQNRNNCEYSELPPFLIDALVAREDHRFYTHAGVDIYGLMRVFIKTMVLHQRAEGGGSTITQQLAKSLFPREENFQDNFVNILITKMKEWVIAIRLEKKYTKQEILALYLNSVQFTHDVYGIKTASRVFFNKVPSQLKVEEGALLIGILKGISMYNPRKNPVRAFNRRNSVLRKMYEHHYLTAFQSDSLQHIPIRLNYKPQTYKTGLATYMREYLRYIMSRDKPARNDYLSEESYLADCREWEENPLYGWCSKNLKPDGSRYNLYTDGLRIYTTLDSRMQLYAETALREHLSKTLQPGFFAAKKSQVNAPFAKGFGKKFVEERLTQAMRQSDRYRNMRMSGYEEEEIRQFFHKKTEMQVFTWKGFRDTLLSPWDSIRYAKYYLRAGFLAVDPANGYVKAYVGGPDMRFFKYDGVMKQRRQVGSTIKPFIYTIAIDNGMRPEDKILNTPVSFPMPGGKFYTPQNDEITPYDNDFVTLTWGLAHSVNQVVAGLFRQQGNQPLTDLLRELGIHSQIPDVPSVCLGTPELSMTELVGAYTVFPGKGVVSKPMLVTRIENRSGKVISSFASTRKEVLNTHTAYTMTQMLCEVVKSGTGQRIRNVYGLTNEIGGKTGTTQNQSDGWFVGITPNLVAAAWVGGDEPSIHFDYMSQGQGASMALPIYAMFMKKVYADPLLKVRRDNFEKPEDFAEEPDSVGAPSGSKQIQEGEQIPADEFE